jgi:two-component system KDP operon response regulator KdpE
MKAFIAGLEYSFFRKVSYFLEKQWPETVISHVIRKEDWDQLVYEEEPDIVFLGDREKELKDVFGIVSLIRSFSNVLIVLFSDAFKDDEKLAEGLSAGADGCFQESVSVELLLSKVRALLRRTSSKQRETIQNGSLTIDFTKGLVTIRGQEVKFDRILYKLLCLLAKNAGRLFTYDDLLDEVWGWKYDASSYHTLVVSIGRLRKRIGENGGDPDVIINVRGIGYQFKECL